MNFLKLVMPWLDSLPYVERYAWFFDAVGYLLDTSATLSTTGSVYLDYYNATVDPLFGA
jgi:hypothetical protein